MRTLDIASMDIGPLHWAIDQVNEPIDQTGTETRTGTEAGRTLIR
jgi:hypothetical protein